MFGDGFPLVYGLAVARILCIIIWKGGQIQQAVSKLKSKSFLRLRLAHSWQHGALLGLFAAMADFFCGHSVTIYGNSKRWFSSYSCLVLVRRWTGYNHSPWKVLRAAVIRKTTRAVSSWWGVRVMIAIRVKVFCWKVLEKYRGVWYLFRDIFVPMAHHKIVGIGHYDCMQFVLSKGYPP